MEKPRVAIIDNSTDVTGALKAILSYVEFVKDDFAFTFVLSTGSRAIAYVKNKGYGVYELPFLELSKKWESLFLYLPKLISNAIHLKKVLDQHSIKLVHVNDFYNLVPVVALSLGAKFKLLTHVRFMPDRFPAKLIKVWLSMSLRYAEAVICVSEAVKNLLPNHPKIKLIYDGLLVPVPHYQKVLTENKHVRLLYLSHYIQGKGQDYALEAFAMAYQENPFLRLKFIGGDMGLKKNKEFKNSLIQRAKILQLKEVVEFAGPTFQPEDEILAADIVLNFSESESFSLVCLEALSHGTPLIASDCGGPSELFVHGESGWLVPNKDIREMKNAILQLSGNLEIRRKISANSLIFVRRKFAAQNTFSCLKALYINVLNMP